MKWGFFFVEDLINFIFVKFGFFWHCNFRRRFVAHWSIRNRNSLVPMFLSDQNEMMNFVENFEHNDPWHWIKVVSNLGYCNLTRFKTRGTMCKDGCSVISTRRVYFYLLVRFFFRVGSFIGKFLSEKCIALICSY